MEWIKIKDGVVLNPALKRAIEAMDPYFALFEVWVTSGIRTEADQVRIITEKVLKHGIDKLYPEFNLSKGSDVHVRINVDNAGDYYWWQRSWSKLLSIGEILNPPTKAEVLFDYFRPGSTVNSKGRVIDLSNHQKGLSFDLGLADLKEIAKRVESAKEAGNCHITGYLVEEMNGAVHCDVATL